MSVGVGGVGEGEGLILEERICSMERANSFCKSSIPLEKQQILFF